MASHEASELENLNGDHPNTCFQRDSPSGGELSGANTTCKADQSNTALSQEMRAGTAQSVARLHRPLCKPPGVGEQPENFPSAPLSVHHRGSDMGRDSPSSSSQCRAKRVLTPHMVPAPNTICWLFSSGGVRKSRAFTPDPQPPSQAPGPTPTVTSGGQGTQRPLRGLTWEESTPLRSLFCHPEHQSEVWIWC